MANKHDTIRSLGAEDVQPDDYIAISHETFELIPDVCDASLRRDLAPLRIELMPHYAGYPMKVVSVCLPFVLVEAPTGCCVTLDLRRHRVVRLSVAFGRKAFKRMRPASAKRGKR